MAPKNERPTAEQIELAEEQIVEQSKRIDFFLTEYSVEILAKKIEDGEYVVPEYQREYTWEDKRKSRFIESIMMGLPIPFLFFWEMPDGKLEIVDGSQRLRTLHEFIYGDMVLEDLDPLTYLSGFKFSDLPESRQRKFKNRSVRGIVLNEHADEAARLDMFERINTGSKIANNAEIRRGALAGPFMDLVIELADSAQLAKLAPMTKKRKKERGYDELVTRFFAYGDGLDDYKDRPSDFLYSYVRKMNGKLENNPEGIGEYRERFSRVLAFVENHFPNGFRKTAGASFTPRARFEAIAIGTQRALSEKPELSSLPKGKINVSPWIEGDEFQKITSSDGANALARLNGRIDFVKNKLINHGDE